MPKKQTITLTKQALKQRLYRARLFGYHQALGTVPVGQTNKRDRPSIQQIITDLETQLNQGENL